MTLEIDGTGLLSRELGRLLQAERHRARLTQFALAMRAGVPQQYVSRVERGRASLSTAAVERLFLALRLQVRVEVRSIDEDLDASIARVRAEMDGERSLLAGSYAFLLRWCGPLPCVLDGVFGALLHGVPVPAGHLDLLVAEGDFEQFARWIRRLPNAMRYSERWRDFSEYELDPEKPGPLRWRTPGVEVRARLVPQLPEKTVIRVGEHELPVRLLTGIAGDHPEVARVIARIDA